MTFPGRRELEEISRSHPTPFYLYDGPAIEENAAAMKAAFSWNAGWREYFAVKATPNPEILRMFKAFGFGADCSSLAELRLAEAVGMRGDEIMFTSNDTPDEEFAEAWRLGATINLDDEAHWERVLRIAGDGADFSGRTMSCRYAPESVASHNGIIGSPEDSKFGMTRAQLMRAYAKMKAAGVGRFGIHAMIVSNELDVRAIAATAELLLQTAKDVERETGARISSVNIGGGVGIPYRPGEKAVGWEELSAALREVWSGAGGVALHMECGRRMTGPYGRLVARVRHVKKTRRSYAGLDASMADLMRPGMYGAYHRIEVPGKEDSPGREVYDVTGPLCENNDKFAVKRELPRLEPGDFVTVCDAGAHGRAMGFQYNGRLRCAELLLRAGGEVEEIRRAENLDDYFATLPAEWRKRLDSTKEKYS